MGAARHSDAPPSGGNHVPQYRCGVTRSRRYSSKIGPTLVCSGITNNENLIQQLTDATHVDRLNIGPIPTTKLNWLQPHEGNIIDFLFRSRAYQLAEETTRVTT